MALVLRVATNPMNGAAATATAVMAVMAVMARLVLPTGASSPCGPFAVAARLALVHQWGIL